MSTKVVEGSGRFKRGHKKVGGRKKGTPNKSTALLKDAILMAAQRAGGGDDEGITNYLYEQADANPVAFMSLLGKVLPMQIANDGEDAFRIETVVRRVVRAGD